MLVNARLRLLTLLLTIFACLPGVPAWSVPANRPEPEVTIPRCRQTPVLDGRLSSGEWQYAAALTMFEAYPNALPQVVREEQPLFYLCWDSQYLYVAMDSIDSNTNTIVAACSEHDNLRIIGDDCLEIMLAPGSGQEVNRYDFPTYYLAANALGTLWDCKFVTLLNEAHNSWESGAELANSVDGTRWICEMRVPLASISLQPPADGTVWRLNLDRTYFGYFWNAWNASGGLNDARVGGNLTFDSRTAAVRLLSVSPLIDGKLQIRGEVANPTNEPQTVTLKLSAVGRQSLAEQPQPVGAAEVSLTVPAGAVAELVLGQGDRLQPYNHLTLEATDAAGRRLYFVEREMQIPALRFAKKPAPEVPLVYIFPRFLPSLERLAVRIDYTAWAKKTGYLGGPPTAEIRVWPRGKETAPPALQGAFRDFTDAQGTWRASTQHLPEGEYVVKVRLVAPSGQILADYDDWFEKRIFDWMKHPRGVGDRVPSPYTPLEVSGQEIRPWGRAYRFADSGLLAGLSSQGKELLAGPAGLQAEAGGKALPVRVTRPFSVTKRQPGLVEGKAELETGGVRLVLETALEYDGFLLYRLTYAPVSGPATLGRLRSQVPLRAEYCKFYSAAGDTQGTTIPAEVLPDKQGKVYDSVTDTRSVACSPSFATCFWVGDYDTCFSYAADNDRGWVLRDDRPAVEAWREGERLTLWLNLIDRPMRVTAPRSLEFAFQAGPLRPNLPGWRGMQDGGYEGDARLTIVQIGGSGDTLFGGANFLHPGETQEQRRASREKIDALLAEAPGRAIVGYHYWGTVPKGLPEARVFRGEWGIDKYTWEAATSVREWAWQSKRFGENRDNYIMLYVNPVPSYVDFLTYAYDEALKETHLSGHYDDTGYPKPVYDEELGLGYRREDGRKVYSSGLWLYRERWKREAYLNFLHGRPNFLRDSQHVHAHFLPAYGLIGIWAPCERGYYNPFPDRDNLDFYGSMERYVAYNPARQVGQPAMVGMSSPQWAAPLLARDTRSMMLLALLNDQDVGCFGNRDTRVVQALRHARSLFRPWEDDVRFVGYWQNQEVVKCDTPGALVSLYHAPRGALFLIGNVGDKPVLATVEPDWERLALDPGALALHEAESGALLPLDAGSAGQGFQIKVPRHDLRLVLAGAPGAFGLPRPRLGADLPRPRQVFTDLSEHFTGSELSPAWKQDVHEGNSGVWLLDGRLCVQGAAYGFAHTRRELGIDNFSAQVLIMRAPTGANDLRGGSLFLYWANGEYVQATPGPSSGKFVYLVSGQPPQSGSPISTAYVPNWWPHTANWVRISLQPEAITFSCSTDGKQWIQDHQVARGPKHQGAPQYLILGSGGPGDQPHLDNVMPEFFSPTSSHQTFFSDLVVGRDN